MQLKNSFDEVTQKKIIKGFLLALSGGIAVGLMAWASGVEEAKALLLSFISLAVPTIANGIKEFMAGE